MICSIQHFHIQKGSYSPDEYEDAYASEPGPGKRVECVEISAAIADGASDSIFTSKWAKLLVNDFINRPGTASRPFQSLVDRNAKRWHEYVMCRDLPWYAEEKAKRGAFATFVGIHIYHSKKGTKRMWRAIAIGDATFFHIRKGSIIRSFPVDTSEDFDNTPLLISSRRSYNADHGIFEDDRHKWGQWVSGDIFILATDALASWSLAQHEAESYPFEEIQDLVRLDDDEGHYGFEKYINHLRSDQGMTNDDVTCSIIELHAK